MTLTFLVGLQQPDRLEADVHEVHVAERIPVIGLDRLHPSTRTPAEAPVPTHPCSIPVAQSRGRPQAPQPYRHGCAARTEARQGGCVVVAVRKGRGLPAPRGAAPRAASRQGEISPPTPLAPNRAPTSPRPLPTTPLLHALAPTHLAPRRPSGGRRHLRAAAAAARARRAAARADAPRRRAPGRGRLRVLLVDAAGGSLACTALACTALACTASYA